MIINFEKKYKNIDESFYEPYREIFVMKKIIDSINGKNQEFNAQDNYFQNEIQCYENNTSSKEKCAICYKNSLPQYIIRLQNETICICKNCLERIPKSFLKTSKVDE